MGPIPGLSIVALVSILLLVVKECTSWPEGTYGIPMPQEGCPSNKVFEWMTGSRIQKTEPTSHASTPVHLAGITSDHTDKIVQNFCMKTSYPRYGKYDWNEGSYCIFKKGNCPRNFKSGWIYWDDAASFFGSTIQNFSGTVPDGDYDRNTKIYFCCRQDGSISVPIELPAGAPFYLFRIAGGCQKVKNTEVSEEWVYWADEDFIVNFSGNSGMHPKITRSKHPFIYTKLFYCYYTPKETPTRYKTTMTVIYVISGIIGFILLAVIISVLVQKCCTKKQEPSYIFENAENTQQEAMIMTPPSAPPQSDTQLSNLHILRRNGAANRENEIDNYEETVEETSAPPRYSALDHPKSVKRRMETTTPRDEITPMLPPHLSDPNRISCPPSYDDVIKEKQYEGDDVV